MLYELTPEPLFCSIEGTGVEVAGGTELVAIPVVWLPVGDVTEDERVAEEAWGVVNDSTGVGVEETPTVDWPGACGVVVMEGEVETTIEEVCASGVDTVTGTEEVVEGVRVDIGKEEVPETQ